MSAANQLKAALARKQRKAATAPNLGMSPSEASCWVALGCAVATITEHFRESGRELTLEDLSGLIAAYGLDAVRIALETHGRFLLSFGLLAANNTAADDAETMQEAAAKLAHGTSN